jgi:hypothetical protein
MFYFRIEYAQMAIAFSDKSDEFSFEAIKKSATCSFAPVHVFI